ncbi:disease resistance protein RPV1-like isoform X2 [Prosopis cineraria]|uniref:disease resistance protein RPV1-like isoform X2 n=1 Tax=Prosopis cineraria TaxID=364024 RepID=UPI00240F6B0A|nr:disease resistance protein RPV1-like isoform X2 [Prosopis cineraria]
MGTAASTPSFSSQPISSKNYDVFISFRGEDTRRNFTSHLYTALTQKSIRTYIDYQLPKGDDISESLIQAIKDSLVSVVVFSENYASSKWCLDELSQILRCRKDQGQFVIPVFYEVDPSDVRKQKGTYQEAFAKHERDFRHNQDKVKKWKDALFETANLAGWHSQSFRDESELIQNIINDVLRKLDHRHPSILEGLVGIDENCESIELLLEKVPIIGIWGMGGIGKTTMAKVVFDKLSPHYQSCCFIENIREESKNHGLKYIRDKLVSDLLMDENIHWSPPKVLGSDFVRRRLSWRKVFIVLDDVDNPKQLEYLAKECDCLGQGSRVIITTRDKHLLIGRVNEIYMAKPLNFQESFKLFNLKAFHRDHPEIGYEWLSKRVVFYTKGNPLALIVLGSFLHSKTKKEWDSALRRLKKIPNQDIQEALKLSFDGLNDEEKEIFLDIAFFLKGEVKEHIIQLLDSCGFHASIGIRTLQDKALITMGEKVWMHDLIQEMGWEIVRQECIKEPGRRTRLRDPKDVYDVLRNNRGTEAVEGIILNVSRIRDIYLAADTFKEMTNLRFLKFYSSSNTGSCNVHLQMGLESISNKMRYFEWNGYPSSSLPSTFCAESLVELKMQFSQVYTLWEGVQDFVNLKRVDLRFSRKLIGLPDFSKAQNLESVNLYYCESLCYVHPSLLSLNSLVSLDLGRCKNLKSLQRSTGIEILHPSIGSLTKLRSLHLNGSKLKNFPLKELCCLRSLEDLGIYKHAFDKPALHVLFENLRAIRKLSFLNCSNLTELPNNIKQLSRLQKLYLRSCRNLQYLPKLPLSVKELDVTDCTSISINRKLSKEVGKLVPALHASSIGHLANLKTLLLNASSLGDLPLTELCCFRYLMELRLRKCRHLVDEPKLHILFESLRCLQILDLEDCFNLTKLPYNIRHLSRLQKLTLNGCTSLQFLPQLPQSLRNFIVSNCTSLEKVFASTISRLLRVNGHNFISFHNCEKLDVRSRCAIGKHVEFSLKRAVRNKQRFTVFYPGNSVPLWFGHNWSMKGLVTIELSLASDHLLGFVFCSVIPQFVSREKIQVAVTCKCYFEEGEAIEFQIFDPQYAEFSSDHVLLCCDPYFSKLVLERFKGSNGNDGDATCNQKILFSFVSCDGFIQECGICPIYASEYQNFVRQRKMKHDLGRRSKRHRDIDELELEPSKFEMGIGSCDGKETLPLCKKLKMDLWTLSKGQEDIEELEALLMRIKIR